MPLAPTTLDDGHPTPEQVAGALRQLPPTPRVLSRLYSLLRRSDTSLQQIGTLLRFDPALTARVLKLGNQRSAARGVYCLSLEHAINEIGRDEIAQMVAYVADSQALVRPISIYGLETD